MSDRQLETIVIGGGVAGLAAAERLARAGRAVLVLEAAGHFGGRTRSVPFAGGVVDLGASWIHRSDGNPLTRVCERHGLERRSFDLEDVLARQVCLDGTTPAPQVEVARAGVIEGRFFASITELVRARPNAMMGELIAGFFAAEPHGAATDWARFIVTTAIEADLCAPVDDIAAANYLHDGPAYGGDDVVVVGGYARMIDALAHGLEIRLHSIVEQVSDDGRRVQVRTADGQVLSADEVIVTVPLGVLKAGAIAFDPPLGEEKRAAIDRVGFGTFEKAFFAFADRWWADSVEPSGFYLRPSSLAPYWLDLTSLVGAPVLVTHLAGPAGERLAALPVARRAEAVWAELKAARPAAPEPVAMQVTDWAGSLYTRGGYARLSARTLATDIAQLGQSHGPRVHFAGEATSPTRYGYVDGAYLSGVERADALLRSRG